MNSTQPEPLLQPIRLGPFMLPNRIVMAPLTRFRARMPSRAPWELNAEYYRQRASAGLIVTEGALISPMAGGEYGAPGIYTEEQVEGWRLVTQAVHEAAGHIVLQLWHMGRQSHRDLLPGGAFPVAPSALPSDNVSRFPDGTTKPHSLPRALETEEIPGIVGEYRTAAERAQRAGFDGVEIHAANGYLIEQFLSDDANRRTDRYGGSVENRARFLLEVVKAVLGVWPSRQVGVRLSPGNTLGGIHHGNRWETYSQVVSALNQQYELGYFHLVEPHIKGASDAHEGGGAVVVSRHFRPLIKGETRLIAAGAYTREAADAAIAEGDADMIAFGRLFVANPDLPERFAKNAPLNPCDYSTFYTHDEVGYTDYPFFSEHVFEQAELRRQEPQSVQGPGSGEREEVGV